ncbi:hypothetical protein PQR67_21485 [Paraburkholderia fungorum]|uniref:hypothetical protein n=1 Tax=Paraburkholderia fungorum TaxID=134537 RepID=UPI0038BAE2DB
MTQPLALIEGDLAFPKPRPFDGLPPPFGSRRRAARVGEQHEPPLGARTAAQQAIQDAAQRKPQPARTGPLPPGVKHILLWKASPQRSNPHRFDEALAEAKRYLEMGNGRPRSSRSDHVLAASIFAGCTIALTWLLVTCSMKDAEKVKALSVVSTVLSAESPRGDHPKPVATTAVADTQTAATAENGPQQSVAAASAAAPRHITQVLPRQAVQVASHADDMVTPSAKTVKRVKVARLTEAHHERLALTRTLRPATQPSVSKQPEWTARSSAQGDTFDKAALLDWATQQRAHVTTRATVPVPGDADWNARMTQRRVTDNPDAFQTGRVQK